MTLLKQTDRLMEKKVTTIITMILYYYDIVEKSLTRPNWTVNTHYVANVKSSY